MQGQTAEDVKEQQNLDSVQVVDPVQVGASRQTGFQQGAKVLDVPTCFIQTKNAAMKEFEVRVNSTCIQLTPKSSR